MNKDSKIFIAGHTGLIGSAILRQLHNDGYYNILLRSHKVLDLTIQEEVETLFRENNIEYVFLSAAKVGGIYANNTYPAEFIYSNLSIQTNVIHYAWKYNVKKLLFLGSSCIYPRCCPQPMKEGYILTSELEKTNEPYAISKLAGIIMCQSYNRQHRTNFISCMPTNLYGPNDNYHNYNSHVIPALIRRFHEAKIHGEPYVNVWGTGLAIREFLFSEDCAEACIFLMNNYDSNEIINIGYGEGFYIQYVAQKIKEVVGYHGSIIFDRSMPDGTPKKLLDSSKINVLGWRPKTSFVEGLNITYSDFLSGYRE